MNFDNTDRNWMNDAPALAGVNKKNPFTVPDGYFNSLNEHLNALVSIEDPGSFQQVFDIPSNYFEQLPAEIETRILLDKLKSMVPEDGFTVPAKYFENLEKDIISQTSYKESSIRSRETGAKLSRISYAAAACVTLALGSILLLNLQSNSIDAQMKKIPDQEIINYLQLNTDVGDTPAIIENLGPANNPSEVSEDVSEAELEHYINTTL
jgi:hypothetical protein